MKRRVTESKQLWRETQAVLTRNHTLMDTKLWTALNRFGQLEEYERLAEKRIAAWKQQREELRKYIQRAVGRQERKAAE